MKRNREREKEEKNRTCRAYKSHELRTNNTELTNERVSASMCETERKKANTNGV